MRKIYTKIGVLVALIVVVGFISCSNEEEEQTTKVGNELCIDGPHVFVENGKYKVVTVNEYNGIEEEILDDIDSLLVKVPKQTPDHFYVKLDRNVETTKSVYESSKDIFVVSDIEGNYFSFVNLLIGNKITDDRLRWSFGDGHLVLNGDFVDRGPYVTQVLWLIYKLEQEAKKVGGHVHFILGNHEVMNLEGNFKYVQDKYCRLVDEIGMEPVEFYSNKNVIGEWLRTKNVAERIGDVLFTHGGMSSFVRSKKLSLEGINEIAQSNYGIDLDNDTTNIDNLLFSSYGVLWYRGLVKDYKYYPKATNEEVDDFLNYYQASSIVIGHCIVSDISAAYEGKVIRIDVEHPFGYNSKEKSKALLIEKGIFYKVDDQGNRNKIK